MKQSKFEKLSFVLVGPEKTGSTSLSRILDHNNQILIPKDEIPIFENPDFQKVKNIDLYFKKLFKNKKNKILGIKRPNYISKNYFSKRIYNYNKKIKIIITIRDPYKRFVSHYFHLASFGLVPFFNLKKNFYKLVKKDKKFLKENPRANDILASQNYWENYINLRKYLPKKNILILDIKDIQNVSTQKKIDKFLGLKLNYNFIKENVGSYDYFSIFLRMLIHKIVLKKDENHRLHKRKINFFQKVIVFSIYILFKLNFFKKKIKIDQKLKIKIYSIFNNSYKKIYSLKI